MYKPLEIIKNFPIKLEFIVLKNVGGEKKYI